MQIIGCRRRAYDYDAFGNEKNPDALDSNPFRYCGEYLDAETGDYYLRARYYDPTIGRFTQEDTHWNTVNGIYGDSSQQYHYRDALGTAIYVCIPNITAIAQSGNLYLYCINSPILYHDALGLSFRVVGFGLQLDGSFSLAVATAGLGFEAVIYTDSLICGDSDALLCVYYYGGGGGTLDLDRLSSQLLTDPNIVSLVQKPVKNTEISLSASVSVVTGSEAFTSPKDYEGPFETFSITVGHAKVAYSYSETSRVYSAGVSTSSTSVSKTDTKYRLVATVPINFAQTVTPTAPASLPQQTATISMPGLHPASRPNQHRVDMLY